MATVFDVAAYILENIKSKSISTVRLQKLVYYCQAWHLVWERKSLFPERIEAWVSGPVIPKLFDRHRGKFLVNRKALTEGRSDRLADNEKETIDIIINDYGNKTAEWLIDLTHSEDPWREARGSCGIGDPCTTEITQRSMIKYYGKLYHGK